VAGVPLSSVVDCRLRRSFRLRHVDVVVGVVVWKAKGTTCASSIWFGERTNKGSLACRTVAPRLQLWKRGPLAPVVGEGS